MAPHHDPIAGALREHLGVCDDLLALARKEADGLGLPQPFPAGGIQAERKALLARLESSSRSVAAQRNRWSELHSPGCETPPELARLVQTTLDTIMRVLVSQRENEEGLLRRGLLPPRSLARPGQSQPSFLARVYQRSAQG